MADIDEDRVEVIVTRILNDKLEDYRHVRLCDAVRNNITKEQDKMSKKLDKIYNTMIGLLITIVATLVAVLAH